MLRNLVRSFQQANLTRSSFTDRGIFGGKNVGFGNSVSHSHRKTRRSWYPNIQTKLINSEILGENIRMPVTTYVLRCIDKAGGLDNYLLNTKAKDLVSKPALELRRKVCLTQLFKAIQTAGGVAEYLEKNPNAKYFKRFPKALRDLENEIKTYGSFEAFVYDTRHQTELEPSLKIHLRMRTFLTPEEVEAKRAAAIYPYSYHKLLELQQQQQAAAPSNTATSTTTTTETTTATTQ